MVAVAATEAALVAATGAALVAGILAALAGATSAALVTPGWLVPLSTAIILSAIDLASGTGIDFSTGTDLGIEIDFSTGTDLGTGTDLSTETDFSTGTDSTIGSLETGLPFSAWATLTVTPMVAIRAYGRRGDGAGGTSAIKAALPASYGLSRFVVIHQWVEASVMLACPSRFGPIPARLGPKLGPRIHLRLCRAQVPPGSLVDPDPSRRAVDAAVAAGQQKTRVGWWFDAGQSDVTGNCSSRNWGDERV
jgi:hypothetical protein